MSAMSSIHPSAFVDFFRFRCRNFECGMGRRNRIAEMRSVSSPHSRTTPPLNDIAHRGGVIAKVNKLSGLLREGGEAAVDSTDSRVSDSLEISFQRGRAWGSVN